MIERLSQLLLRLRTYDWWVILIEMAVIWSVVYLIVRFLRGTRGAGVLKGLAFVLTIVVFATSLMRGGEIFARLNVLFEDFLAPVAILAVFLIFQPELRRALTRLGEARLFGGAQQLRRARVIEELLGAVEYLSKNKIGALIAIERKVGLGGIIEAGIRLDAEVSRELLSTLFWPGSALHDLGVVVRGDQIIAAGVQFPLADGEGISQELGSRHRSAIGLSQEADGLILVVSEETGIISVAEHGALTRGLDIESLRTVLVRALGQVKMQDEDQEDARSAKSA
ncbi:MAG: TIGR00159 family protein [Phycisphaerae bacterium]|jgi:diadenylate cyclase|nr:TIGR00159 family protein [Phycisphaerae bacterium]MDP6153989.1 diadenylate cyclase CdaA [Phycisphaeraceae bacterium]MDP7346915.1 diadenylate cyclase CdaA [Phycisphaeraceae bacterium]